MTFELSWKVLKDYLKTEALLLTVHAKHLNGPFKVA
nr:nucleotidyltransferase substrate binding protein [Lentibacillus jeotgali]